MRASDRLALPVSAFSFAFNVLALPFVYVVVPVCRPAATLGDLVAAVSVASGATAFAFAGVLISLLSLYTLGTVKSRTALALAGASLAIATAFIVFGLALRACPT
ncbi:MAG TPA: hypothetical protein VGR51_09525 [Thermoplasmata archaeon]|nr:hypothetical protein [Thermoplasmata archaeon]